ncbi:hypothetical protein [Ferrovibrio sp.]|uniref:hypothetical protein n=1 Tax=Ferrovibrio sp. TaxID=1917215 RepID=UPI003D0960B3
MAKRKSSKTAKPADNSQVDPVDAMLRLVATTGWLTLSLGAVAQESGLGLAELYRQYPSKLALLRGFAARIDAAMLAALGPAGGEGNAKDKLFEALMARFDALAPYKEAVRVLSRDLPRDPIAALCFAESGLAKGLDWALASAQLDAAGWRGALRRKILGAVYVDSLRIWLSDDSADLSRTMAHLDKRLGQAEGLLSGQGSLRGVFSRLREKRAE